MPPGIDRVRDYFERCADRFDGFYREERRGLFQRLAHEVFRKPGLARRFQATMDILGDVRGARILDAGCGSGIYSIYLARQGASVTGIDFSSSMLSLAERNARAENCEVRFLAGDFLELENEPGYDHLLLIGVFDYVPKDRRKAYLDRAAVIARRKIVATFPKRYTLLQTPIRYFWLRRQNCPVYFYTKGQVRRLARQSGLTARFRNCGPIWTVEFGR
jgi:magnesium-protoporphyrin O-methyltransferase